MKSIIVVFVVTVLFLVGMTKFTNDTNYNEALRYHELSQYYNYIEGETEISEDDEILFETIEIDVTFFGAVRNEKTVSVKAGSYLSTAIEEVGGLAKFVDELIPGYVINSFSPPGGSMPKSYAEDVYSGEYIEFKKYEDYRKYIIKSRKQKDKRFK